MAAVPRGEAGGGTAVSVPGSVWLGYEGKEGDLQPGQHAVSQEEAPLKATLAGSKRRR